MAEDKCSRNSDGMSTRNFHICIEWATTFRVGKSALPGFPLCNRLISLLFLTSLSVRDCMGPMLYIPVNISEKTEQHVNIWPCNEQAPTSLHS
jgi:hypothetical protein